MNPAAKIWKPPEGDFSRLPSLSLMVHHLPGKNIKGEANNGSFILRRPGLFWRQGRSGLQRIFPSLNAMVKREQVVADLRRT